MTGADDFDDEDVPTELFQHAVEDVDWSDDALADRDSDPEALGPIVVNWRTIDDADRDTAVNELVDWVQGWLIPRYTLSARQIPDCWAQHGDLIEELSALHTAWKVAFDPADGGYGPIGWHERLGVALTRTAFHERCAGTHRPDKPRTLAPLAGAGAFMLEHAS